MNRKLNKLIFYFVVLFSSLSCIAGDLKNYDTPLAELLRTYNIDARDISILIDKSEYTLTVMKDTLAIKEYPVVFGGNPVDDKRMQGDLCTPEGTFKMISKYPHKSWSKFIWIDYPNHSSWQKHNEAKRKGAIPQNAKIGGEVGIHGVPRGTDHMIDMKYNWTLGCISLKNKDIDELYPYISESTRIVITK